MHIKDLNPNPNNPRTITDAKEKLLKKSLDEFGDLGAIIFNKSTNRVVGGHQRLKTFDPDSQVVITEVFKAPTEQGTVAEGHICLANGERFKYREVKWTEAKEKAAAIAANKNAGSWDIKKLSADMLELKKINFDLNLTMFDESERIDFFPSIVTEHERKNAKTKVDEDSIPNSQIAKHAGRGDLFLLGDHLLLCGSATSLDDLKLLIREEKIDMVFTDPPYNFKFKYNSYSDDLSDSEYREFCRSWFDNLKQFSKKIVITPGTKNLPLWMQLDPNVHGIAVWIKKNWITSCRISNLQQWEPILFYGGFKRSRSSDLYEINRVEQQDVKLDGTNDAHPCPKQIELLEDILKHYAGDTVLDVFGGSGSTLIACEKLKKRCFMVELDPHYCDVIIERFQRYTGKKAQKISRG